MNVAWYTKVQIGQRVSDNQMNNQSNSIDCTNVSRRFFDTRKSLKGTFIC